MNLQTMSIIVGGVFFLAWMFLGVSQFKISRILRKLQTHLAEQNDSLKFVRFVFSTEVKTPGSESLLFWAIVYRVALVVMGVLMVVGGVIFSLME